MAEEPTPFLRTCSWDGEEFEGKGYVLTTTEGTELVCADHFLAPHQPAAFAEDVQESPAGDQAPADDQAPEKEPAA
jgi:hypothetical protein